jgi:hypothetical protein
MHRAIVVAGIAASLALAPALLAQSPPLQVKANTWAGSSSPIVTIQSNQVVSVTNPIPDDFAYVYYYIFNNSATQTLTISDTVNCQPNVWSCGNLPTSIAPGHSATVTMTLGGSATIDGANPISTITMNTNFGPFVLAFQGIEVANPGMTIVSGDGINITSEPPTYTYEYPSTTVGVAVSRDFTVTSTINNPSVPVDLYNYTLTPVTGNCFSLITGSFPQLISYGSPYSFRWRMLSGSAGTCESTVSFWTNVSQFPVFTWNLKGTVTD